MQSEPSLDGLTAQQRIARYHELAEGCLDQARHTYNRDARKALLVACAEWRRLARELEKNEGKELSVQPPSATDGASGGPALSVLPADQAKAT